MANTSFEYRATKTSHKQELYTINAIFVVLFKGKQFLKMTFLKQIVMGHYLSFFG